MYIFWLILAIVCIIAYFFLEWKISDSALKSIMQNKAVTLPYKKRNYLLLATGLSLLGYFGIYMALMSYYGAGIQLVCILGGIVVAIVSVLVTANSLKYVTFEEDES